MFFLFALNCVVLQTDSFRVRRNNGTVCAVVRCSVNIQLVFNTVDIFEDSNLQLQRIHISRSYCLQLDTSCSSINKELMHTVTISLLGLPSRHTNGYVLINKLQSLILFYFLQMQYEINIAYQYTIITFNKLYLRLRHVVYKLVECNKIYFKDRSC